MGDSFYDEAVEYVNKHGSSEIKKELLERENYWKEENMSDRQKKEKRNES